jgi:hypothetical protein
MPFRGHDEPLGSLNRGNFFKIFKLLSSWNEILLECALKKCQIYFTLCPKENSKHMSSKSEEIN